MIYMNFLIYIWTFLVLNMMHVYLKKKRDSTLYSNSWETKKDKGSICDVVKKKKKKIESSREEGENLYLF